jgi:hypothetical protein
MLEVAVVVATHPLVVPVVLEAAALEVATHRRLQSPELLIQAAVAEGEVLEL